MIPRHRPALAGTIAVAAALIAPAAAQAARPLVTTGSATKVAFSSAHLTGSVGARGKNTVFFFQYGRTIAYGTQTAEAPAGRATGRTRVGADVLGLEPTRLYHYRLVARNRDGTTLGRDRTFRAKKQPLGFLVTATPNPVPFGDDFAVTGALGGTGAGGRAVALQGRGFPYTGPWTPLGNAQVTAPNGAFSFSVLNAAGNTQYRVVTTGSPGGGERRRAGRRRRPRRDPRQPPARAPRRPGALLGDDHAREGRRAVRRPAPGPQGAVDHGGRQCLAHRGRELLALLQALQGPAHEPLPDLRQRRRRHEPVGRRADGPASAPAASGGAAGAPGTPGAPGASRSASASATSSSSVRPLRTDAGSSATTSRPRSAHPSRTLTSTPPLAGLGVGGPAGHARQGPAAAELLPVQLDGQVAARRALRQRRRRPRPRTCRGPRR